MEKRKNRKKNVTVLRHGMKNEWRSCCFGQYAPFLSFIPQRHKSGS